MPKTNDKIVAGQMTKSTANTKELTPLMLQYHRIKDEHKDDVLFFRLGDFYEMFDDDAVEVSRLLNLTLTHRAGQPMCGIPYHASKLYIARLLRCGKRIAICEQVGEIAKGKGLTERKVVEIITPGTAVESEYLDGGANNFLASLCINNNQVGFAYIDVTTGEFYATSWPCKVFSENFAKELGRVHPKELLLPQSLYDNKNVKDILSVNEGIAVAYYPDWNFDTSLSYRRLVKQFEVVNLKSFSLDESSAEVAPAGFLLDYLQKTAVTSSPHVSSIKIIKKSDFVEIDESSRKNLEIVSNTMDGSVQYTLLECVSFTQTAMGKRLMRNWLLYPLTQSDIIISRQKSVEYFFAQKDILEKVRNCTSHILDIERLAGRIAMERAHGKDLQALRLSLESWIDTRSLFNDFDFIHVELDSANKIIDLIKSSILDDPATSLTEGRIIKEGWSSQLDEYRNVLNNFNLILEQYAEEEKQKTGISNLRIRNNNNAGYYIEVTKGKLQNVPSHFIMRRSLVNADRYTTERLQELEQSLNEASSKILQTERDLFIEIRNELSRYVPYLMQLSHEISYIDVVTSLAHAAILFSWVKPDVDDSSDFEIIDGRHPVVESHIPSGEFVPNDLKLYACEDDKVSFALITGPNMAGKSTYLRQNALIALLAQTGSYVPASKAHIGVVDRIFCRVGASDNLAKGESTFLVEMSETANILRSATEKSLVIMDEVGRGTSTEDGLSIAWAISEHLLNEIKCKTLFATHYHELTRLEHNKLVLLSMAVSESNGSVVFLRKVKQGASENSYGIHVARLAGVPESVIDRANEILLLLQKKNAEEKFSEGIETVKACAKKNTASVPLLFSEEELVIDEILSLEIDNMTPIEALQTLSRWKASLSGR